MSGWDALVASLWGHGDELAALPMSIRAFSMFLLLLLEVRLAGARSFGRKSSFDNVVAILLGAIAARGVVGASPFGSTVVACAVIVAVHRGLARLCVSHPRLASLVEGEPVPLYVRGRILHDKLKLTTISEADLLESHRLETQSAVLSTREEAFMERDGRISFVRHDDGPGD